MGVVRTPGGHQAEEIQTCSHAHVLSHVISTNHSQYLRVFYWIPFSLPKQILDNGGRVKECLIYCGRGVLGV